MKRRLHALLRKAGTPEPVAAGVQALLLKHIRTKRDYENLFSEEGEGVGAFVAKHALPPATAEVLEAMQRAKNVFVPNPVLDAVLTALFLGQVAWLAWRMAAFGTAPQFAAILAGVHVVVLIVQAVSTRAGRALAGALVAAGAVPADPLSGRVQLKKWQEQCWQLAVHVGFTGMELALLSGANAVWWEDPRTCWIPHPRDQHALHSPLLRFFYLAQLAVWVYTCFVHRFLDERRKDYFVMYTHHIVTIALVGMSWQSGYWRIGLIIVYVHDISDIFVDVLKLVNYLKLEGPRGWFASEVAYVACVLSWMYWRLWRLPFRAIRGSFIDAWDVFATYPRQSSQLLVFGYELSPPDMPNYFEANVLLFTLQALHVYWFHLFLMIGYRILTESTREASRQEYEGDSDGESEQIDGGAPRGNDGGGRGEGGAGGAAGKGKGKGEGADAAPGGGGGKGARQRRAA